MMVRDQEPNCFFFETLGIWVVTRVQTRPFLGASFFIFLWGPDI